MAVDLVNQDRLASVTALSSGAHSAPYGNFEACIMEATSFVANEPWSDHPECTCPVIAAFMRGWNDGLPSDEDRTRLLLPFVPAIVGTKGSEALEERRSLMAADWLVRVHIPAWLRLAGLKDQAATLEALPEITSLAQAPSLRGPLEAVCKDAAAAWDAARAAARDAAWDAAGDAAWDAAKAAAWDALKDTVTELQQSALVLVERMVALTDDDLAEAA